MKKNLFSEEFLKRIRTSLPGGGQTEILARLAMQGYAFSRMDVYRALHGFNLHHTKPPITAIIKTAIDLIYEKYEIVIPYELPEIIKTDTSK